MNAVWIRAAFSWYDSTTTDTATTAVPTVAATSAARAGTSPRGCGSACFSASRVTNTVHTAAASASGTRTVRPEEESPARCGRKR